MDEVQNKETNRPRQSPKSVLFQFCVFLFCFCLFDFHLLVLVFVCVCVFVCACVCVLVPVHLVSQSCVLFSFLPMNQVLGGIYWAPV